MGKLDDLRAELDAGHPVTGAYDADAQLAADQINAVNRTRNRTSMSSSEIFQAIDAGEYAALSADQKSEFWGLLGMGSINPFGQEATLMTSLFGGGSTTLTTLNGLRRDNISRADELGLGRVRAGTIDQARAL